MWPMDVPFAVLPLSWLGAKRRPTQFASNKNVPGIKKEDLVVDRTGRFDSSKPNQSNVPQEKTEIEEKVMLIDDGRATTRLLAALQASPEARPMEVPELPE